MKTFLLSSAIFLLLSLTISRLALSTILPINVGSNFFDPQTTVAFLGDTIKFQWVSGHHTTTCDNTDVTILPEGADPWNAPIDAGNTSFSYIIAIEGDYHYECLIHGSPMEGDITAILPVELVSFSAIAGMNNVMLNWETNFEINNAGFEIQRKSSIDKDWIYTGYITGAGNTNKKTKYSFTDQDLNAGKYNYRLKQIDYNGEYKYYTLLNEVIIGIPTKFDLSQNYPNPFNPTTKINYDLPFDSKVSIVLFDITGRQVADILNTTQQAGYQTVQFNASNLASGTYFYQLNVASNNGQSFNKTLKMMLVK